MGTALAKGVLEGHAAGRVSGVSWPVPEALLEGSGLILEDAGTHQLKGFDGERRLFRLVPPAA